MTKQVNGVMYTVVGRYIKGNKVVGYHVISETGGGRRFKKDTLVDYVKQGRVTNCEVQNWNGKVLLRGKGINLNELPTQSIDGEVKIKGPLAGQVAENKNASLGMFKLIGRIMDKRECVGYRTIDTSGTQRDLPRDKVLELAANKVVVNAKTQNYHGELLLRGDGVKLTDLPSISFKA